MERQIVKLRWRLNKPLSGIITIVKTVPYTILLICCRLSANQLALVIFANYAVSIHTS